MTGWLLGTLLATSGLILLVLLIREPVRRRFGSRVAYGLWLIPAARLLMPTMTETVERTVPAGSPVLPLVQPAVGEPMLLSNVAAPAPTLLDQLGGWPTVLLTLWLGVAIGIFLSRFTAFLRDRRAILASGMEIGRLGAIRIVRSDEVSSPVAFGIIDRVIAVPAAFERLYDERERRLALDHELAHHRSGDLVANVFAFVLLCLQWFNPLAWVAHAAFRFDQEAACDARVLDKARADDRAGYGRAIAKAASGRALLFASALDRRNTLHRRLRSMLNNTSAGTRTAGKLMILAGIAVALPMTATRAVEYIDVPAAPAPPTAMAAPQAPAAPAAPAPLALPAALAAQAAVPVPPAPPMPPARSQFGIDDDRISINGHSRRWSELTPTEKQEVRREIAEAKAEIARTRIDTAEIESDIRESLRGIDRDELRRDLADARADIEEAVRDIDANAADLRRSGVNPEAIKAQVRASLRDIDVDSITHHALASVQPAIVASIAAAEASVAQAEAELERLEERLDDD
jgi:bla regulator protein blaR1